MRKQMKALTVFAGVAAVVVAALPVAAEDENTKPQEIVDKAVTTLNEMSGDAKMQWFRDNVQKAKAVVIIPTLVKAGFIFGGSGGSGLVMTRGGGSWSYPSFVTMGSVSFGLQAGAEGAQVVLLAMTEKGRNALLSTKLQLGADTSLSAGPVGAGAKAATTDILSFSRAAGLYGGVNVEGSTIAVRDGWNQDYYNNPSVQPVDILVTRNQTNPGADALRTTMAGVGGR